MKDGKLVLGVLGLGEGRSIISAALSSSRYVLGNICDLSEELCRRRCGEFSFGRYTTDYADLLSDGSIDVIAVYTPDQHHAEHIRRALLAGKHVICAKPVILGLSGAKELLECRERSGKKVFVGQSTRYFEPILRQREQYETGALGELVTVETHYKSDSRWFLDRPWSRQEGFSWMYNCLIHAVDLAVWYLPDIEEVFGYGAISPNTREFGLEVEDTLAFLLKDKSGRIATVKGDYAGPCLDGDIEFPIGCTLRCTKGISRGGYSRLTMYSKTLKSELPEGKPYALDANPADYYDEEVRRYDGLHGYYFRFEGETYHAGESQNYMDYFAEALEKGETPLPDLREGVRTVGILEAMSRSMRSGQPVRVDAVLGEYGLL